MESRFDKIKSTEFNSKKVSTTTNMWLKNYLTRKLETIEENYEEEDKSDVSIEQHNRESKKEKNM